MNLQYIGFVLALAAYGKAEVKDLKFGIYNGEKVKIDEQKHLVKIFGQALCSASIIGSTWLLTAGHCVYETNMTTVYHHSKPSKPIAWIYRSFPHPQFHVDPEVEGIEPHQVNVDIALVKTSKIRFNQHIKPIKLVTQSPKVNQMATLAGYGESNWGPVRSIPLQGQVSIKECPGEFASTTSLCTYGMIGTGSGDSGGPLTTNDRLAAVNSASFCEAFTATTPCISIATNVADKLSWIKSVMKQM